MRIEASTSLSKEEIEKMKKDAELHAQEDKKLRELADMRNTSDALIYTAEKTLRDMGDKVPAELKSDIESKVIALKEVKDTDNESGIKSASEALSVSLQKIGEMMYKNQPQENAAPETESTDSPIKEAEFEEKKDQENT